MVGLDTAPQLQPGADSGARRSGHRGVRSRTVWLLLAVAALAIAAWAIVRQATADPSAAAGTFNWAWLTIDPEPKRLRWLLALLPGSILVNHMVYLLYSRRKQFSEALAPVHSKALADLYFARGPLLVRYLLPAIVATILCSTAIAALTSPQTYLHWLWAPMPPPAGSPVAWPAATTWGNDVLRGAALGFVGAYLYILLQLTERARRRDITSGLAVWAAAMPVLGPMMGGVAALLLASGAGVATQASFTRDAVFFVAGMLPQQFAGFVQSGVRRLFQNNAPTATRTTPLMQVRGVGPEVEARLQEEGINDVSALAYASPYALIRSTTYAPKQVADWIDEALLIVTVPIQWEAIEKAGITGAMDLAWYKGKDDAIKVLADEVKMQPLLLANVIERLDNDAQVGDLRKLYWDEGVTPGSKGPVRGPDEVELRYRFTDGFAPDACDRAVADLRAAGVKLFADGSRLTVLANCGERDSTAALLATKSEIEPDPRS